MARNLAIIQDLEEILTFTPPIDPSTWEVGSLPKLDKYQSRLWTINDIQQAGLEQYEAELTHWTRYMPPGLTRPYLDQVSRPSILHFFDHIILPLTPPGFFLSLFQHLPKSLVKTISESQKNSPPEPIEEAMVSENSSLFESVLEESMTLTHLPTCSTYFSASSQLDPADTKPAKPKHHWKPALNSIRRTMSLNRRSNKVESAPGSEDDTSTPLSRQKSRRRRALY